MNLNKTVAEGLIADAVAAGCYIKLEISSQGAVLTLRKDTVVTGTTDLSRNTTLVRWLDKNDPHLNHNITKAFYALP